MEPGARLGRYSIQGLIGRGAMGTVYRATDPSLGRDVALKVLPAEVAADWVHGLAAQRHAAFDESLAALGRACELSKRGEYPLPQMAVVYADCDRTAVGDMDAAIEFAHEACDEREPVMVIFARNFPNLQRLRADPRFADVLRRLALPQS